MSNISLQKSVRSCDVSTGEAPRIQSDRFFNPSNMVCIPWNGMNNKGQQVCPDSWWTKTAGCNSSEDRILVENELRPKYTNYVTLGAEGISGHIYGSESDYVNSVERTKFDYQRTSDPKFGTGNFGLQMGADVRYTSCSVDAYERNMAQMNQKLRGQNFLQNGSLSNSYKSCGGN
jgi:hypothetical protein